MAEKLDTGRLRIVLEDADNTWFRDHSGNFDYQKYLDFVAEHVAKNYHKKPRGRKAESNV